MVSIQDFAQKVTSLDGPFVHAAVSSLPEHFVSNLRSELADTHIVQLSGQALQNTTEFTIEIQKKLGVHITQTSPKQEELFWMRFEDLISSDIDCKQKSSCLIIVHQAELLLRQSRDGLVRFGNSMSNAAVAYANPDDLGLDPPYRPEPLRLHTLLVYDRVPKRAPQAEQIRFGQ